MRALLFAVLFAFAPFAARAEELAAGLSKDVINITSSFNGTDLVLFGAVESEDGAAIADVADRDIVVVVRGDAAGVVVMRKERLGPIWINRERRPFANVPGFYYLAATRELAKIADEPLLDQFRLGLAHLGIGPAPGSVGGPPEFRQAIIRAKVRDGLYSEHAGGVQFISGSLFRATVALPANVPTGNYQVNVYLFRKKQLITGYATTLSIDKSGVERALYRVARDMPWLYGLTALLLATLAGWLAAILFRERH